MGHPLPAGDHPIEVPADDVLGRDVLAAALSVELQTIDVSQGVVAAITGPWGSGKTSLLNLTARRLRDASDVRVLDFNPWLFSGTDELAAAFLAELARELSDLEPRRSRWRRRTAGTVEALANYSAALSAARFVPGVATAQQVVEGTGRHAASRLRGDTSLTARRDAAVTALSNSKARVVVLVDDIDRLTRDELRHLFRLVRLTASLPNVVYLLSMDPLVVAGALSEGEAFSGSAYLEKILSLTCAVPVGQPEVFRSAWIDSLNALLEQHPVGPIDEDTFGRVQLEILDPLMQTLRDAKRVLTSLPLALRTVGSEVAFADLVALESLRVLAPEMHAALPTCFHGLTAPSSSGLHNREVELAEGINRFVAADRRGDGKIAKAVITVLFPAGARHLGGANWASGSDSEWRHQRRVAAPQILEFYLTGQLPPGRASRTQIDGIIQALTTVETGRTAFSALPDDQLENVLEQLMPFSESAPSEVVAPAVEVLLEQLSRLRTDVRGMMDFGAEFAVTRPVLRLLRRLEPESVATLARRLVATTSTLYAAFELVTLIGHRENAGHRLVSPENADALEVQLRNRLVGTPASSIAIERHVTRLLFHTLRPAEDATQPAMPSLLEMPLLSAVLRDGIAVARSQVLGSVKVTLRYSLHWDILVRLYGGERRLLAAVDDLVAQVQTTGPAPDEPLQRALHLVDRYRAGWRPSEFGEPDDD